jgi:hypothetical protein
VAAGTSKPPEFAIKIRIVRIGTRFARLIREGLWPVNAIADPKNGLRYSIAAAQKAVK